MASPDQKEMFDALDTHHQIKTRVDRVLKIVLPIIAFLLCVICANLNIPSTLGTFFVLVIAFYAVGIRRMHTGVWLAVIALYCLADIYLSYGTLLPSALGRQMGTMLTFTGIIGLGRPYMDRWFMAS
ncbi:hypothetical protein [Acinetobacter sp. WZC-1]|uniref:hypothetical protein n=1 Tax=Acinetobacter sp. WZC-1 TaxID=3459034 RepID=UPI00403D75D6